MLYGIVHVKPNGKRIGQLPMYKSMAIALKIARERKQKNPTHDYIVKEMPGEML